MANLTGIQTQETDWRSDRSLAYAVFRLTFGVNLMMRGVVRIALGQAAFVTYMLTQFKDVPVMPPAFLVPFATVLPYVESVIGLLILIGLTMLFGYSFKPDAFGHKAKNDELIDEKPKHDSFV